MRASRSERPGGRSRCGMGVSEPVRDVKLLGEEKTGRRVEVDGDVQTVDSRQGKNTKQKEETHPPPLLPPLFIDEILVHRILGLVLLQVFLEELETGFACEYGRHLFGLFLVVEGKRLEGVVVSVPVVGNVGGAEATGDGGKVGHWVETTTRTYAEFEAPFTSSPRGDEVGMDSSR